MPTINGRACVVNGTPVDKVFSNGKQVYGRNYLVNSSNFSNVNNWNSNGGTTISVQDGCLSVFKDTVVNWRGVNQVFGISSNDFGKNFMATTVIKNASDSTAKSLYVIVHFLDNSGNILEQPWLTRGDLSLSSDFQTFEFNSTVPNDNRVTAVRLNFLTNNDATLYHVLHKSFKFEIGDAATPWTPAPEDIK